MKDCLLVNVFLYFPQPESCNATYRFNSNPRKTFLLPYLIRSLFMHGALIYGQGTESHGKHMVVGAQSYLKCKC